MTRRLRRDNSKALAQRGASSLQEFLRGLAFLLLARGITPKSFSELARFAFVQAAAARSKLRNGRVNHSRVAAQTGLTRADVKRLLDQDVARMHVASGDTAVERVIAGWRKDRHFSYTSGNPRSLRISGAGRSFTNLSRKYAGDIPYRAVLAELQRIGAIRRNGDEIRLTTSVQLRRRNDFSFLNAVTPVLIDGLRVASANTRGDPSATVHRLTLSIPTEVDSAFVRDRCTSSAKAMLDGLSNSLGSKVMTQSSGNKRKWSSFAVTILLVENRAKRIQRETKARRRAQYGY